VVLALSCALTSSGDLRAQVSGSHSSATAPSRGQTLDGIWSGTLQAADTALHFVLHLTSDDHGSFVVTLDSLDQGVYGIEARIQEPSGSTLKFAIQSVNASYEGEVSADRRTIEGTWLQGGASLPLSFHRQPHMSASRNPQGAVATSEGTWQGALETNGMRYRLQLRISHDLQGKLAASMDSIDQGIKAGIAEGLEHLASFIGARADMAAWKGVGIRKWDTFTVNPGRSRRILSPGQVYRFSNKHRKKLRAAIRKSSEI